jgi:lipopolysaccharide export system permease protein
LIVLVSLLSLYIIVDLFTNLDDFSGGGFAMMLKRIWVYYSVRISQIFDKLSEAISLLGAMFTVAWLQRNNELLPQLSAGISTRRVVRPILIGAGITLMLGPVNQEFVIPKIADQLTLQRDDLEAAKATHVNGTYDPHGMHIEGVFGYRKEKKVEWLFVTFPDGGKTDMIHLTAEVAYYIPPGDDPYSGGWNLFKTTPETLDTPLPRGLTQIGPGQYFLKTADIDFDAVTRGANWYMFGSLWNLRELLAKPDARRQTQVAVAFHMRLTRPIIGALLVLLGLSVILRDQNRNVFINAGLCLIMCALFYAAVFGCKYLGEADVITPPLAAWMPVLLFGPLSVTLFDAVHT